MLVGEVQQIVEFIVMATTQSASPRCMRQRDNAAERPYEPFRDIYVGDAGRLPQLADEYVDFVVTSPPYWRKRDYSIEGQISEEATSEEYVAAIIVAMTEWRRVLRPSGSVFLNIGDTYWQKSLQGIPSLVEASARRAGWILRNRIIWVKKGGMPDPVETG